MIEIETITGLGMLFDLSPDMLFQLDNDGCILRVSKHLSQVLGYQEGEMLSKNNLDYIHPEDKEHTLKQYQTAAQHQSVHLFKNRYRCANGSYKSLSWNVSLLPDNTFYASARDITHYLNIQNQLAKALTDNQKIYDNSLDVLCVVDAEGCFIRVSKAAKKVWGYSEQELLGRKFLDFVHPDDVALTIAADQEIKSGNNKTNFENRYIHKNGSIVPIVWSAQYHPLEQVVFGIARDATEREKQKEQLFFNQRRLEALLESGNDLIVIISKKGIYQYCSTSVDKILGFEPAFFLGKSPFEFIHPDDINRIKGTFGYILSTEDMVHVPPFRIKNANGDWCWVESFATNMVKDPAISGIVVNSRDVSIKIKDEEEKRLAAEKLSVSNQRYQLVTEVTKDVIWDWNLQTNQLSRDKIFEKHFGYPEQPDQDGLKPWEAHIHPDDRERVLNSIHNSINNPNEKFWREEYRFFKADGAIAFITDQGYIIRNREKKAIRMVGAMNDKTELKEKELRILEQNQRLREIAQINSHVIRKPVATILGLMEIFDKTSVSGKQNLEIIQHLATTTQELDDVIKSINDKTIY